VRYVHGSKAQRERLVEPRLIDRHDDVCGNGDVGLGVEMEVWCERVAVVGEGKHGDAHACMVVLCQEKGYSRFLIPCCRCIVEIEGKVEEGIDLAAGDKGLTAWARRVAVETSQIEAGRLQAEAVNMFWWRDGIVLGDWWAPVDEMWWYGGVWTELDVVVSFIDEGAIKTSANMSKDARKICLPISWQILNDAR
jgi:hypothetical protein